MRDFKVFMFILATPADPRAFKELLEGFDDLHYLTGEDVLIICPSLKANGKKATREQIARYLVGDLAGRPAATYITGSLRLFNDFPPVFAEFRTRQLQASYDFSAYI